MKRRIGNRDYHLSKVKKTKAEANSVARSMRDKGMRVRVIKLKTKESGVEYGVYFNPAKR